MLKTRITTRFSVTQMFTMTRAAMLLITLLLVNSSVRAATRPVLNCASNHILVRFKPSVRALLPDAAPTNQLSTILTQLGLPRGAELRENALARRFRQRTRPIPGGDMSRSILATSSTSD